MIKTDALEGLAREHMKIIEEQIHAAWRSRYDYLYVVRDHSLDDGIKEAYVPSNNGGLRFSPRFSTTRYDVRDEAISDEDQQTLRDYR